MEGKLVIISAPSGAGKSTLIDNLLKRGVNLEFSVSATTRKPRGEEVNGREYYFMTEEEFSKRVDNGDFIEWEEVYANHMYGTLKTELHRIWKTGNHVLFDIDVKGAMNLKNIFGARAISIFIMPPSIAELERRLIGRGTDNADKIKMRVEKVVEEMNLADRFDEIIVNKDLDEACEKLYQVVTNFLSP
ncbi:MAG TPA: guanylate kinase [Bacteroidetes bacterium]|jgi:guanylate kinase|nr:guanylate kinase [Bacteroidota bacterium]